MAAAFLNLTYREVGDLVRSRKGKRADAKTVGRWMNEEALPEEMERFGPLAEKLGLPLEALTTGAGFPSIDRLGGPNPLQPGQSLALSVLTATEPDSGAQVSEVPTPEELARLSLPELVRLAKGWVAGAEAFGANPKGTDALRRYLEAIARKVEAGVGPQPAHR